MMENILSPLKRVFMAWLNPRSTSITTWAMDMILAFVCGVGLFHLLIPYLQRNRFLPTSAKRKRPGKTHVGKKWRRRCRKRSDAREVTRDCLEKLEVTLNLAFVLQNYLGKLQDQEDLHQRLHNDATNESLKPDTKRAQQTLEQRAESPSPSLPRVSLAPLTECSLHIHHLGKQSNFNGISLGTFPWSYFLENADMILYPWTTLGLYSFHRVIYLLCCWWESAKTLFLRTWAYGTTSRPGSMFPQPTEISFQRDSRFWQTVAGGISFIKNNIQLLEMFISKKVSQKLCKEKGKGGPFFTPLSTGYPPGSLGSLLKSQNERRIMKNLLWEAKTEMWQQPSYPQGFYSKDELDSGDLKRSQFFWGLPSLHSESLVASAWLQPRSSSCGTKPFTFNNVFLTESPPNGTVHLSRPQDVAQSQLNTQKLSPPASKVLTEDHFPYSFSNQLHSAPLQINSCRTSGMTSERWDLEWSLKEQLKCEEVLTSKLEITQEITDQTTLLLPQERRAPQMNKLDCTFPRNSTILECQKPEEKPSLPEEATDSKWQPFPSPRIPESQLMQHQEKFPGKYECQPQNEHELLPQTSQPPALTCESKIGPTCSDQVQAASHLDNPVSPCQGMEQDLEPGPVQGLEHTHVSKSDWMMPKKYSRSHLPRTLDKKFLEVHLERKLDQMKQGMIPVRVRQSLLTRSHAFSKPSAPAKPRVVSCTNQPSRVNTFKELSFLDTESRLMLETNTVRCWMKHRWYPQLQARDSSLNVLEDPASPLPQPGLPSGSCDSEVAKPDECSQKDSGKEEARSLSVASLKLLFSAPSPAEIQRSQGHNPSHVSHRYLEACLSEQKNSLSRQPSTSSLLSRTRQQRTVLESVKGGQEPSPSPVMSSHKSQEESVDMVSRDTSFNGTTLKIKSAFPPPMTRNTKERAEVKKEMLPKPELPAETSLLQISQITHMNLKTSESQGTSNSPFSRKFSQDPGYAQQKAQVICEIQCKLGIDLKQPQNPATDNFQHIYTDKPPITDNLSPKASLTSTQSTCQTRRNPATSQIPCDLWMKGQSQGKQETSDIRVKAQGQNLSNTFDFHADRQDCGKSGPVLQGRVKPSQSWESSPSPQDRKVGSSGKMISHKMGPHPSEKTKIQNTLQFFHPDPKSQDKEDSRPRVECPLATIQSRGAEASKLCTDSGAREAQTLRKPGGQILLNETGPWHYHGKESQDIHANYQDTYANYQDIRSNYQDIHSNYQEICSNYQGICSNYQDTHANNHVHPSDPERTPVMIGVSCGHQASHRGNGHSTKNGCATNKASTQSLLSREPVSLVRPCLDRLGGGHNSGHIFHHPIHYH